MVGKSGVSWVLAIPVFLLAVAASLFMGTLFAADNNAAGAVTPSPAATAARSDAEDQGVRAPDNDRSCERLFPIPKAPVVCR